MPMPDGLTSIDGELYYADRTPGNGFVANVDINPAENSISANDALGSAGAAGLAPPPVRRRRSSRSWTCSRASKRHAVVPACDGAFGRPFLREWPADGEGESERCAGRHDRHADRLLVEALHVRLPDRGEPRTCIGRIVGDDTDREAVFARDPAACPVAPLAVRVPVGEAVGEPWCDRVGENAARSASVTGPRPVMSRPNSRSACSMRFSPGCVQAGCASTTGDGGAAQPASRAVAMTQAASDRICPFRDDRPPRAQNAARSTTACLSGGLSTGLST